MDSFISSLVHNHGAWSTQQNRSNDTISPGISNDGSYQCDLFPPRPTSESLQQAYANIPRRCPTNKFCQTGPSTRSIAPPTLQTTQHRANSEDLLWYFHTSRDCPRGTFLRTFKPPSMVTLSNRPIAPPNNPIQIQTSLIRLPPRVLFVQFPCEEQCRTLGICVHFQFLIGTRRCPDGLICEECSYPSTPQTVGNHCQFCLGVC